MSESPSKKLRQELLRSVSLGSPLVTIVKPGVVLYPELDCTVPSLVTLHPPHHVQSDGQVLLLHLPDRDSGTLSVHLQEVSKWQEEITQNITVQDKTPEESKQF